MRSVHPQNEPFAAATTAFGTGNTAEAEMAVMLDDSRIKALTALALFDRNVILRARW